MKKCGRTCCFVLCLMIIVTFVNGCSFLPPAGSQGVIISGEPINNEFNNTFSSVDPSAVRLDNKIYFHYETNNQYFRIIEISEDGAKPLKRLDLQKGLRAYNDQILFNSVWEDLKSYTPSTDEWKSFEGVDGIDINSVWFQQQSDAVVYDADGWYSLSWADVLKWHYQDEEGELSPGMEKWYYYLTDDAVYYTAHFDEPVESSDELHRFDLKTKTDEVIWTPPTPKIIRIWEGNDALYISAGIELYKLDLTVSEPQVEYIRKFSGNLEIMNMYDSVLYIEFNDRIEAYDLETQERTLLFEDSSNILNCYIFDDTWVYFEKMTDGWFHNQLIRIKQDGTCFEVVYG